jgi:hypothetical protein
MEDKGRRIRVKGGRRRGSEGRERGKGYEGKGI